MFLWLLNGKAYFKYRVTKGIELAPESLNYRKEVIDFILSEKSKGRKIILCSGANVETLKKISDYLKIFDEVYGSNEKINLTGNNKATFLVNKFGYKKYDYIGDNKKDIPVWDNSENIYTVNINKSTKKILKNRNHKYIEIKKKESFFDLLFFYLSAFRIYQWSKNLLIFLPIFLAQEFEVINFINACMAFLCFSFIASFIYVFNDILDLPNDAMHPRKKNRPICSGRVNIALVCFISVGGLITSFLISAFYLKIEFLFILIFYVLLNGAYTINLKKIIYIDVIILSFFYVLRILSGGIVNEIEVSNWLIIFSTFFFLFLALIKRMAEIINTSSSTSKLYGRSYDRTKNNHIKIITLICILFSNILLLLYFTSTKVLTLYENIFVLILICPLMFYWQIRIYFETLNKKMLDDPILYIIKDKLSFLVFLLSAVIILSQMKL
tara:strand:+ start:31 stop:1350 length:1320 start_codon:yes stop_codon:yes gene_type:complete